LKSIISKFPKCQRAELAVQWLIDGEPFRVRLIVRWNLETKGLENNYVSQSLGGGEISTNHFPRPGWR
jgi:hypothetical protein